jgi:hypothetical protein
MTDERRSGLDRRVHGLLADGLRGVHDRMRRGRALRRWALRCLGLLGGLNRLLEQTKLAE